MAVLEGWKSECSLVSWFILVQILHNTDRLLRCMQLTLTQGQIQFFSFLKNIYLSIFGCLGSSLLLLALVVVSRGYSWLQCTASSCGGFFCWQSMASRCLGLSSCTWAELICHTWNLPKPETEPMFSVLRGRLSSTAPPGKSPLFLK